MDKARPWGEAETVDPTKASFGGFWLEVSSARPSYPKTFHVIDIQTIEVFGDRLTVFEQTQALFEYLWVEADKRWEEW